MCSNIKLKIQKSGVILMSRQFFKRYTAQRGENRELYFTPINTIEKIVKS